MRCLFLYMYIGLFLVHIRDNAGFAGHVVLNQV